MPVTTTTLVGRNKLEFPDLGYEGGNALHTLVGTMFTKLSDHDAVRFISENTLLAAATLNFTHNFGVNVDQLFVQFFESGAMVTEETRIKSYQVQTVDINTLQITNISGGSKTFTAQVWAVSFDKLLGVKSFVFQTTDATPVAIATFQTATNKSAMFEFVVVARINGTTSNVYTFKALGENNAGTVTATLISSEVYEENALLDAYVDALSSSIRVIATGKAATNIDWHVRMKTSYLF